MHRRASFAYRLSFFRPSIVFWDNAPFMTLLVPTCRMTSSCLPDQQIWIRSQTPWRWASTSPTADHTPSQTLSHTHSIRCGGESQRNRLPHGTLGIPDWLVLKATAPKMQIWPIWILRLIRCGKLPRVDGKLATPDRLVSTLAMEQVVVTWMVRPATTHRGMFPLQPTGLL